MIAHQGSLPERRSRKQSSQEKERLRKAMSFSLVFDS